MSKVADILNRYKALNEGDARDKEIGGKGSSSDKVGDGGDASLRGIIEKLVEENWSKDNDTQAKAVAEMKKIAESDDELGNKFMEYMDKMSEEFDFGDKDMDEMDGSANKGAKDADDEDEEGGDYKKKDGPNFSEKKGKKK